MSAIDYSKWDDFEVSDDSDIECHPNVRPSLSLFLSLCRYCLGFAARRAVDIGRRHASSGSIQWRIYIVVSLRHSQRLLDAGCSNTPILKKQDPRD